MGEGQTHHLWATAYVENLQAALAFYADPKNWEAVEVEKITDVLSSWVSGPAVDGGERARKALDYAEGRSDYSDGTGGVE